MPGEIAARLFKELNQAIKSDMLREIQAIIGCAYLDLKERQRFNLSGRLVQYIQVHLQR